MIPIRKALRVLSQYKDRRSRHGDSHVKDKTVFYMGVSIPVWHLYIETALRSLSVRHRSDTSAPYTCLLHEHILLDNPYKNIERHTAHAIVSWPNPKQWVIVHTSDLMMIIRQSIYIISIITKEMSKLKTHSPAYCIMDNWEKMLNLTHTLDKLYLTGIF